MGYIGALSMKQEAGVNRQTIGWHFSSNCYPPIPSIMIEFALKAIRYANQGKCKAQIKLPEGVSYHGKRMVPVYIAIENLRLEAFLEQEEE